MRGHACTINHCSPTFTKAANIQCLIALMLPTLFIPHGGGPLPLLGDPGHTGLVSFLKAVPQQIQPRPKAILLVSAHWEESEPQLTSASKPSLLFDYYGFPPETYKLHYPAPGDPSLAQQAADLLRSAGFNASLNPSRGLDHGAFIPLMLMYPDADIPVVQLSLKSSLDPEEHYRMGAALAPLRAQGVLLLGSGMSFHNMGQFARQPGSKQERVGQDFQLWLLAAATKSPAERQQLLSDWSTAPGARNAHPREEHLLPLMVVAGAAHSGSSSSSSSAEGSSSGSDSTGHALWDGECLGAAVAGIGFGGFPA